MNLNGKDVRCQNTEYRIQISPARDPRILNSEICILTSDIFAVDVYAPLSSGLTFVRHSASALSSCLAPIRSASCIPRT